MKRLLISFLAILSMTLQAGVIVKQSGERIEDVSIKSASGSDIIYLTTSGEEITVPKSEVSAILYDDGRYEEIRQSSSSITETNQNSSSAFGGGNATEFNVYAFGNYIKLYYITDHKHDGATVEYRLIYKDQREEPVWTYLGTTPFAYTTMNGGKNPLISKDAMEIATPTPLVIENYKQVKKIEFRLTQEGYKTVVVSPLVQIDVTGLYYFISLNNLKPLKKRETNETSATAVAVVPVVAVINEDSASPVETNSSNIEEVSKPIEESTEETEESITASNPEQKNKKSKAEKSETPKRVIPQGCYIEGKKVYDEALEDARMRALKQGYSKEQANAIAPEIAALAKEKAIDECYNRVVVLGEDLLVDKVDTLDVKELKPVSLELSEKLKKIIPMACYTEGKKAYDKTYKEAYEKAMRQGYSKSQAVKIASEAAQTVKQQVIDEYYNRIVIQGEFYLEASQIEDEAAIKKQQEEEQRKLKNDSIKAAKAAAAEQARLEKEQEAARYQELSPFFVQKIRNNEYSCMEKAMDKKAYQLFLQNNCPQAYAKYKRGNREVAAGWTLFALGLASTVGGVSMYYIGDIFPSLSIPSEIREIGKYVTVAGSGVTFIGLCTFSAGYSHRNKSIKMYNKECASPTVKMSTLDLRITSQGIGLAFCF